MRKHCQRVKLAPRKHGSFAGQSTRSIKRGPYPKPMRERVDYVFQNADAKLAAVLRHPDNRRIIHNRRGTFQ